MKVKRLFVLAIMLLTLVMSTTVYAKDLDTIDQNNSSSSQQNGSSNKTGDESFDSILDYMRGHNAVTNDDMSKASKMTSPITKMIGTLIGIINLLTVALIFLITSLDIMYISVPFIRKFLYPAGSIQQSGGGVMGGQPQANTNSHKWISEDCLNAMTEAQPQQQGMGMGMGMGMGGMGGMGGQPQAVPAKQVIGVYLKKRILFLVLFGVCSTILMSSLFLDCGLNLAQLIYKIGEMLNGGLSEVNF